MTFTDVGNDEIKALEKQLYSQTVTFKNAKGKKLKLQLFRPRTPIKTVTLRPVPLEYDLVKLKDVLSQFNWGTPLDIRRGLHKPIGDRRRLQNEYVHVKYAVDDIREDNIPPAMDLEGHYVYIAKPNESLKIQCNYCKAFWHNEDKCFKKTRDLAQLKCSFCGLEGHTDVQCVQKIFAEEKQKEAGRQDAIKQAQGIDSLNLGTPIFNYSTTNEQLDQHKTNIDSSSGNQEVSNSNNQIQERADNTTEVASQHACPTEGDGSTSEKQQEESSSLNTMTSLGHRFVADVEKSDHSSTSTSTLIDPNMLNQHPDDYSEISSSGSEELDSDDDSQSKKSTDNSNKSNEYDTDYINDISDIEMAEILRKRKRDDLSNSPSKKDKKKSKVSEKKRHKKRK